MPPIPPMQKLLPARAKVSSALMQTQASPFSPRALAAVKALVAQQKKRKQPKSDALQNATQTGDF